MNLRNHFRYSAHYTTREGIGFQYLQEPSWFSDTLGADGVERLDSELLQRGALPRFFWD